MIYHYGFSKAGFSLSSAVPTEGYSSGQEKRISGYSRRHAADLTALNFQSCLAFIDSISFSAHFSCNQSATCDAQFSLLKLKF